jgi:hypothetical protein
VVLIDTIVEIIRPNDYIRKSGRGISGDLMYPVKIIKLPKAQTDHIGLVVNVTKDLQTWFVRIIDMNLNSIGSFEELQSN